MSQVSQRTALLRQQPGTQGGGGGQHATRDQGEQQRYRDVQPVVLAGGLGRKKAALHQLDHTKAEQDAQDRHQLYGLLLHRSDSFSRQ